MYQCHQQHGKPQEKEVRDVPNAEEDRRPAKQKMDKPLHNIEVAHRSQSISLSSPPRRSVLPLRRGSGAVRCIFAALTRRSVASNQAVRHIRAKTLPQPGTRSNRTCPQWAAPRSERFHL